MDALEAILSRQVQRTFADKPVEREKLAKIVDAGRHAMSPTPPFNPGASSKTRAGIFGVQTRLAERLSSIVSSFLVSSRA
jgi:hypothetical protein